MPGSGSPAQSPAPLQPLVRQYPVAGSVRAPLSGRRRRLPSGPPQPGGRPRPRRAGGGRRRGSGRVGGGCPAPLQPEGADRGARTGGPGGRSGGPRGRSGDPVDEPSDPLDPVGTARVVTVWATGDAWSRPVAGPGPGVGTVGGGRSDPAGHRDGHRHGGCGTLARRRRRGGQGARRGCGPMPSFWRRPSRRCAVASGYGCPTSRRWRSMWGPGLFTGLRVGVATAKALAQALSLGVLGVSSLDVLAAAAAARFPAERTGPGWPPVIDARRGEVFAASYRFDQGRAGRRPRLRPTGLPRIRCRPTGWRRGWKRLASDTGHVRVVGDGALRYRSGAVGTGGTRFRLGRRPCRPASRAPRPAWPATDWPPGWCPTSPRRSGP